ncbi:hypothetical protein NKH77_50170 [Streptomyces sp. M19]
MLGPLLLERVMQPHLDRPMFAPEVLARRSAANQRLLRHGFYGASRGEPEGADGVAPLRSVHVYTMLNTCIHPLPCPTARPPPHPTAWTGSTTSASPSPSWSCSTTPRRRTARPTGGTSRGARSGALATLSAWDGTFFMSLFFFVSAVFVPASYDRHGGRAFVRRGCGAWASRSSSGR